MHAYHRQDPAAYFADAQDLFTAHAGRPHWGKRHTLTAAYFSRACPRFDDFVQVREELDPERRFANDHLRQVLGS